jgi:hypothetical protein
VEKVGIAGQATDGNIIKRMRIAYWTPKTTNTFSEYVILITFPIQQWLHERTSPYVYTYSACLVHLLQQQSTSILQVNKEIFLKNVGL